MDPALVYLHFALHCHAVKNDLAKSCREWRLWKSSALCSAICSALLATNTERGLCCLYVCVALFCFVVAQRDRETPCLHGGHVTLEKHLCSDTVEFRCEWVYIESSWHDMGLNEMSRGRKKEALGCWSDVVECIVPVRGNCTLNGRENLGEYERRMNL